MHIFFKCQQWGRLSRAIVGCVFVISLYMFYMASKKEEAKVGGLQGSKSKKINAVHPSQAASPNQTSAAADAKSFSLATKDVESKLSQILSVCGDVCRTDLKPTKEEEKEATLAKNGTGIAFIRKKFDCPALFNHSQLHDRPASKFLPRPFPDLPAGPIRQHFTYNGRVLLNRQWHGEHFNLTTSTIMWKAKDVDTYIKQYRSGDYKFIPYGLVLGGKVVEAIRGQMNLTDKRVLIVGSLHPWLEAIVLANGAKEVVTLEYANLKTDHSKIQPLTPSNFLRTYLSGTLRPFDAMLTYSSLEHSGLGRCGDGLHPWADLVTMARVWCVTKQGAQVLVGTLGAKKDILVYNAYKCYGPLMTSHLLANFKVTWMSNPKFNGTDDGDVCKKTQHFVAVMKRVN